MEYLKSKYFLPVLFACSAVLILLSFGGLFNFTFWHDDWTHLYKAQQGINSSYPYQFFSYLTPILYKFFGLNYLFYILFGLFLYWLSACIFYKLLMEIFKSRLISSIGVLIFSSGYIGLDSMKMFVGDGIGTLPILPIVLLTLIFFSKRAFIPTFILTFVILGLAPHRYPGLIFPLLLLDWAHYLTNPKKRSAKSVILRNLIFLLIFYLQLFVRPLTPNLDAKSAIFWSNLSINSVVVQLSNIWNFFYSSFYNQFILDNFSSKIISLALTSLPLYITFLYTTKFIKKNVFVKLGLIFIVHILAILSSANTEFINGVLLVSIIFINLFDKKKRHVLLTAIIYTLGLSTFFFASPNMHMASTYRYFMAYSFASPILICALFFGVHRKKIMGKIALLPVVFFVLLRILSANAVLNDFYKNYTYHFHKIYAGLIANLPAVEKPVVIFMEPSTTKIGFALGDAFRVGELKTEAAYAVLYKVPMDRFILPKTKNEIKGERIYHFYYDGNELRRIED